MAVNQSVDLTSQWDPCEKNNNNMQFEPIHTKDKTDKYEVKLFV